MALAGILEQAELFVAYNARFDERFLPAELRPLLHGRLVCAMDAFALHAGVWREDIEDFRTHRLQVAAASSDHVWTGQQCRAVADALACRAVADALACRAVWKHVIGRPATLR